MTKAKIIINKVNDLIVMKENSPYGSPDVFFLGGEGTFIISIPNLASLLKFLLFKGFLNSKVLEGVLNEYYNREN